MSVKNKVQKGHPYGQQQTAQPIVLKGKDLLHAVKDPSSIKRLSEPVIGEELGGTIESVGDNFVSEEPVIEVEPEPLANETVDSKAKELEAKREAAREKYRTATDNQLKVGEKTNKARNEFEKAKQEYEAAKKAEAEIKSKMKNLKASSTEEAGKSLKELQTQYASAQNLTKQAARRYNSCATILNGRINQYVAATKAVKVAGKDFGKINLRIAQNEAKAAEKAIAGKAAGSITEAEKAAVKSAKTGVAEAKAYMAQDMKAASRETAWAKSLRNELPLTKGGWKSTKTLGKAGKIGMIAMFAAGITLAALMVVDVIKGSKNNGSVEETVAGSEEGGTTGSAQTGTVDPAQGETTDPAQGVVADPTQGGATDPVAEEGDAVNVQQVDLIDEEALAQEQEQEAAEAIYTVKKGDNLWNIAKKELKEKNGVDPTNAQIVARVGEVMEKNGLHWEADHYVVLIYPNQKLKM